jgi:cytochrome b561
VRDACFWLLIYYTLRRKGTSYAVVHRRERSLQSSALCGPIQTKWIDPHLECWEYSMTARAERSPNVLADACSQKRMLTALHGCIALLVVVVGVLGLLRGSWPRRMLEFWINIHALFGLLLCGLVLVRFRWRIKHSPRMPQPRIRELSRHLSRIVYLLLYVVIGARAIIGILNSLWHGGAVDFNLFDQRFQGPDYAGFNPKDDFQLLIASGLFALIFVRVLVFRLWLRSVEHVEGACSNQFGASVLGTRPGR